MLDDKQIITFQYTRRDRNITMEMDGEVDITEVIEEFSRFLIAISFHPNTVDEYLGNKDNCCQGDCEC